MSVLRYDGKVAVITGAGNGLGRAYALLLGARGAKVVVNDLGGSASGAGSSKKAADLVVDEIVSAGGEAVANYDSVENGEAIVKTALDKWGKIDILINNAGILRDSSFQKMSDADWNIIYAVHLLGTMRCTRAAWNVMRDQGYGRVIMVTSAAGLYGNFGQANYSAMKMAVVGLANVLALEGKKRGVLVNTVAPIAASRMTATVMPEDILAKLKPEYVTGLVAYLCHESCKETGSVFEVGGGWIGKIRRERSHGIFLKGDVSVEQIRDLWADITRFDSKATPALSNQESMARIMQELGAAKL